MTALSFASTFGDHAVLQQAPAQAVVWGFAPAGAKVSVSFGGKAIDAPVTTYMGQSAFMAKLPPTPSSMTTTHNITATSGGKTITLGSVLFGDVWVCSGQSNMGLPVWATLNASAELEAAGSASSLASRGALA